VLYQLEQPDGALRNAEITVPPIRRRYFKLAVAEKGGGSAAGARARGRVGARAAPVRGARRGPFALGYGRAQVEPARFDAAS
jgi:hypothetical protein